MSELLSSANPVTVEDAGYQELGIIENGVEKQILVKAEDLSAGGEGGSVDLSAYAKTADVAATYAKKTDVSGVVKTTALTGAASATASDTLKILLVDGSTVKQITLADLKTYLTA